MLVLIISIIHFIGNCIKVNIKTEKNELQCFKHHKLWIFLKLVFIEKYMVPFFSFFFFGLSSEISSFLSSKQLAYFYILINKY